MSSFGILCAAMFRFERERVLHCSLYCGTTTAYPVSACSAVRWLHSGSRALRNDGYKGRVLRNDGSTPGPLPLICPSQRILNSCSALIKYRRMQTSLRRIIIRSEGCWLSSLNTLSLLSVLLLYMLLLKGVDNITTLQLHDWIERKKNCAYPQSQDTGASNRTM